MAATVVAAAEQEPVLLVQGKQREPVRAEQVRPGLVRVALEVVEPVRAAM